MPTGEQLAGYRKAKKEAKQKVVAAMLAGKEKKRKERETAQKGNDDDH